MIVVSGSLIPTGLLFLSVERQDLYTAFGQIKITNDAMQKQEG